MVWTKLKKKLRKLNWIRKVNESELSIELVNNSMICLKSAEQGDTLRGESLNFLCIDEFCDIDLDTVWSQILRPSLSDRRGHALFIGTPKAGNQAARDLYDNHISKKNWSSYSYTTAQGGFVSEEEILQAQQDLAPKVFNQEYLASWENFSGVIFNEFGEHNYRPAPELQPHTPIYVGLDFNVNPMSAVIYLPIPNGLHAIGEIYIDNSNTSEIIEEIRNRYGNNRHITAFPDPAGVQRKTSANGNTDIKLLENAGFTVRYHRQHPEVKDRINAANSLFYKRPDGSTRFYIDKDKCPRTVKSLRNWSYKEGTMIPDKTKGWDHGCDAATYPIEFLFPIKKQSVISQPERLTVKYR